MLTTQVVGLYAKPAFCSDNPDADIGRVHSLPYAIHVGRRLNPMRDKKVVSDRMVCHYSSFRKPLGLTESFVLATTSMHGKL